jgi:transposase
MVAAIGTGDAFSKGRDFGAWLGLVPKQISTGSSSRRPRQVRRFQQFAFESRGLNLAGLEGLPMS